MRKVMWKRDAKEMFDTLIQKLPKAAYFEVNLRTTCDTLAGEKGCITRDVLIDSVKKVTPDLFLEKVLRVVESVKKE